MKKILTVLAMFAVVAAGLCYNEYLRPRTVVILSTNDVHAQVEKFAKYAQAISECRDTVATIVVDAGDRWSGNAYVDMVENRMPIIRLFNMVGLDVATFGNHEYDCGQAVLANSVEKADYSLVCCNMTASDSLNFPKMPRAVIIERGGVKFMFTGAVTTSDYGHPDGKLENFAGLSFTDGMDAVPETVEQYGKEAAVRILLSHMGDDNDMIFASRSNCCENIIGGHTHVELDTLINGVHLSQTGVRFANVGVTTMKFRGRHSLKSISYRNIKVDSYGEREDVRAELDRIYDDPELGKSVGELPVTLNKAGLGQMMATLIARATSREIGCYHYGGVRLDSLSSGKVGLASVMNLEPFSSKICTADMTLGQLKKLILDKYNAKVNVKESHRIDIFCSVPYDIYLDQNGDAERVEFPGLKDGKVYKVAMSDYMGKRYPYEAKNVSIADILVTKTILDNLGSEQPLVFDNTPLQRQMPFNAK